MSPVAVIESSKKKASTCAHRGLQAELTSMPRWKNGSSSRSSNAGAGAAGFDDPAVSATAAAAAASERASMAARSFSSNWCSMSFWMRSCSNAVGAPAMKEKDALELSTDDTAQSKSVKPQPVM
jgi:hypothetical protein